MYAWNAIQTMAETNVAADTRCGRAHPGHGGLAETFSIEVLPRAAAKVSDFREIVPRGTRVYVPHIMGTPVDDLVKTAKRIAAEGFPVMPHVAARAIRTQAELERLIWRYREEAGVRQALLLAGGMAKPAGEFHSAIQLLKTGIFDTAGFTDIHMAGHPEGNRDIDPGGGTTNTDAALREKWRIVQDCDARTALVTQFVFSAEPVIAWTKRLEESGILLPVHVGVAGPARLQTLIKYAAACGVGPSIRILQRQAKNFTRLLAPIDASDIVRGIAGYRLSHPETIISNLHVFPLGGIRQGAEWACRLAAQPDSLLAGRTDDHPHNS